MRLTASRDRFGLPTIFSRNLRLYLASRFMGVLALQIQSVAVGWQIYDIERDPLALGYVGLAQFLPMFAFTLIAGDVADRFNRRRVMVAAFSTEAIAACIFIGLTLSPPAEVWPFYATLVLFGTARAFAGPASSSLLPLLVPPEHLARAVAWSSSIFQAAIVAGPAIGGIVFIAGPGAAYGLCLALFVGVATAISLIDAPMPQRAVDVTLSAISRVTAGIAYMRRKPVILGAISLDLFAVLLGGATALLPVFARDILHVGPAGFGLLRSAPAIGAVAIGLILAFRPLKGRAGVTMLGCVAIFGAAIVVFGLSESFYVSLAALIVLGAADMVSVYVRQTLIQLATPDAMRGRVSAVSLLFIGASNELGEFESGVTASWFGTVPAVVIGGLGTLGIVAIWAWAFPDLRKVDRLSDVKPD